MNRTDQFILELEVGLFSLLIHWSGYWGSWVQNTNVIVTQLLIFAVWVSELNLRTESFFFFFFFNEPVDPQIRLNDSIFWVNCSFNIAQRWNHVCVDIQKTEWNVFFWLSQEVPYQPTLSLLSWRWKRGWNRAWVQGRAEQQSARAA